MLLMTCLLTTDKAIRSARIPIRVSSLKEVGILLTDWRYSRRCFVIVDRSVDISLPSLSLSRSISLHWPCDGSPGSDASSCRMRQ